MADDEVGPPLGSRLVDLGDCEHGKKQVAAINDNDEVVGVGHITLMEHGKPIASDAVILHTDSEGRVSSKIRLGGGSGPAQVATQTYRDNYDAIFGKKKREEMN